MLVPAKSGVGSGSSATTGFRKVWNVMTDGGCVGNNSTSDTANLAAADAIAYANGWQLYFPKPTGQYLVSGTVTFSSHCTFDVGAIIHSTSGSVTFNGGVAADITQILNLTGGSTSSFNPQHTLVGYAEWFGAVTNSVGTDCTAAINAAIVALDKTQLMGAIYYCSSTVNHTTLGHSLVGAKPIAGAVNITSSFATQICSTSATATILNISGFRGTGGYKIARFHCTRNIAPTISGSSIGITLSSNGATIEDIVSSESMTAWKINSTAWVKVHRCRARRSLAGTGAGTDTFKGFWIDGTDDGLGTNSGNASLYLNNLYVSIATPFAGTSIAYYHDKGFMDVFCTDIECGLVTQGLVVVGNNNVGWAYSDADFHVIHPILETVKECISITQCNDQGSILIDGGHCYSSSDTAHIVSIDTNKNAVTIRGMEYLALTKSTYGAIYINNSKNFSSVDGHIIECGGTLAKLVSATNCKITDKATNYTNTAKGITLTISNRNKLDMVLSGNKTGVGYSVDATSAYNEFNCSGLDPAAISGGSANKLVINSTQVTVVGIAAAGAGNNVASGVMA
jgi:hypothetical protein